MGLRCDSVTLQQNARVGGAGAGAVRCGAAPCSIGGPSFYIEFLVFVGLLCRTNAGDTVVVAAAASLVCLTHRMVYNVHAAAAGYPLFVRLHPAVQHRSLLCRAWTWTSTLHTVDVVSLHVAYGQRKKKDAAATTKKASFYSAKLSPTLSYYFYCSAGYLSDTVHITSISVPT